MSVEGDLFRVTVKGSRESIIKMMNAALKSFNSDNVIEDSDDAKAMNSKLEMFAGEEGKDIGIPDLLRQGKEGDSFVRMRMGSRPRLRTRRQDTLILVRWISVRTQDVTWC